MKCSSSWRRVSQGGIPYHAVLFGIGVGLLTATARATDCADADPRPAFAEFRRSLSERPFADAGCAREVLSSLAILETRAISIAAACHRAENGVCDGNSCDSERFERQRDLEQLRLRGAELSEEARQCNVPASMLPPATLSQSRSPGAADTSSWWNAQRKWGLGVAIGGALSLAIGSYGVASNTESVYLYNSDPFCPGVNAARQPSYCQRYIDTADTGVNVAIGGFVIGACLAIMSLVLFTTSTSLTQPTRTFGFRCGPNGLQAGGLCGFTF